MNIIKKLAIGALALISTASSWATTTIYIVGSNGDRQATQQAIANRLSAGTYAGPFTAPNVAAGDWTFRGNKGNADRTNGTITGISNVTGSNYGSWHGYLGNNEVVIKTSFIGAAGAVAAVAAADQVNDPSAKVRFPISGGITGTVIDIYRTSPVPVQGTDYELANASFGFSTNFQATTPYNGTFNGYTYNPLTEVTVGISPLLFLASPGFPAGQNLTTQLAQLLYSTGSLSLAQFTGDWTNDAHKYVYAIGRNTDAGQRYGAYAEFGLGAQAIVKQYQPGAFTTPATTTGGVTSGGVIGSQALWPAETISGVSSPVGSGGFVTGANLAPYLTVTLGSDAYRNAYTYLDEDNNTQTAYGKSDAVAGYYLGYVTPGDALPSVLGVDSSNTPTGNIPSQNRGVILKWNGVDYDFAGANVKSGKYTAWVYNRIIKRQSPALAGDVNTLYNQLLTEISTVTATTGGAGLIDDATVKVKKTVDGGLVTPK
jgi:hypothetical protein